MRRRPGCRSEKLRFVVLAMCVLCTGPAWAEWTDFLPVKIVDSLGPAVKYVTLESYTNASCDQNRFLLESTDADYRKEMFAMVLSALHAGTPVSLNFSVSGGQCRVDRVRSQKD